MSSGNTWFRGVRVHLNMLALWTRWKPSCSFHSYWMFFERQSAGTDQFAPTLMLWNKSRIDGWPAHDPIIMISRQNMSTIARQISLMLVTTEKPTLKKITMFTLLLQTPKIDIAMRKLLKYNSISCSRASLISWDPEVLISSTDTEDIGAEVVCFSGSVEFMTTYWDKISLCLW